MSWENDVYLVEEDPPMNRTDPIVKMALTPSAYRRLPEEIEGHIAEFLLPRKIPAGTRGKKYRLPQKILADRRFKKELLNKGKAYTNRAQKRAYNEYMKETGQAEMNAALAQLRAERAALEARVAEEEAQRMAEAGTLEQARWEEIMSAPLSHSAERRRHVAKSRARRGHNYNFRPHTHKKSQNKSKKPSKSIGKSRTKARKQKSNGNNN
jgi:hypothetical protein